MSSPSTSPIKTPSKRGRPKASGSKPATPKLPRDEELQDAKALVNMLKSFDSQQKKVDLTEFAALMGYKNVRSAGNTYNRLRKTHGLKVEAFSVRPKDSGKIIKSTPTKSRSVKGAAKAELSEDEEEARAFDESAILDDDEETSAKESSEDLDNGEAQDEA
ncbi:hypothetical protein N7490_004903 [Penicillium lividum]|nr:hypothetical protein N7490_004903 [Penicillium lividum]